MRKLTIVLLGLVALAGVVDSAAAMTPGVLTVSWYETVSATYKWSATNNGVWTSTLGVYNGYATGVFDPTGAVGPKNLGAIWCVDLFNYSGNPWGAERYTDADAGGVNDVGSSLWAWLNPMNDGDGYRNAAGLNQASFLAYKYGSAMTTATQKRTLQMAMWTAAYGTQRFQYDSGGGLDTGLLAVMVADIPNGTNFSRHEWYDNNEDFQGVEYYQDFMNDVPEPTSLLLLGGALLGGAGASWRRRKR